MATFRSTFMGNISLGNHSKDTRDSQIRWLGRRRQSERKARMETPNMAHGLNPRN